MIRKALYTAAVFAAGLLAGVSMKSAPVVHAQGANRVFEIRTYTAADGKLDALKTRFRDHTVKIFEKHGMTNIGYWMPEDAPMSQNTMVYLIAHASREAARQNWKEFASDPEWKKVASESQVNGPLTSKIESVFLDPTDYSPMK